MTEFGQQDLAGRFEQERGRLWAVAFRLLGASGEAEEARADPIVSPVEGGDPEHEALVADSVGLAMLGVLETLGPEERVAFVLHDMFSVPFEQVADLLDRSPAAARKAASRARKRVEAEPTAPDVDLERQREVVDAFFAAAREGDFDALVAVLHPEVVLRADGGEARPSANHVIRGAAEVASRAMTFANLSPFIRPVLVNGVAGVLVAPQGKPFSVMAFTVAGGRVVAIDALADPDRLERLAVPRAGAGTPLRSHRDA